LGFCGFLKQLRINIRAAGQSCTNVWFGWLIDGFVGWLVGWLIG